MKKITCFFLLTVFATLFVFANEDLFSVTVGLSSGIPFYSENFSSTATQAAANIPTTDENLTSDDSTISENAQSTENNTETKTEIKTDKRVIIGSFASLNLNVVKQVTFFTGCDFLADFNWAENLYAHHLHLGFPLGFKIYPGLAGLNLGLAYVLGFRADFTKTSSDYKTKNATAWGNGFKFLAEYNFAHDGFSKYLPTIGCSWTYMPRGNYEKDNLLTFYLAANL